MSIKTIFNKQKASDIMISGAFFLLAGIEILLVIMMAETLNPGYSIHLQAISDLAEIGASTFLLVEVAGFIWGLFWILGVYFLFKKTGNLLLMILNFLPGIGVLLIFISPENVNFTIHSLGATLFFILGGIAPVLSFGWIKSKIRYIFLFLGILSLIGAVFQFGAYNSAFFNQTLGRGGWERVIIYPILIWLISLGSYLLSINNYDDKEGTGKYKESLRCNQQQALVETI